MATLEDRILGEKLHYYCSSSEDEDEEEEEEDEEEGRKRGGGGGGGGEEVMPPPDRGAWEGSSTNTGPKGVLKDWQRFKQLEAEQRVEQERERVLLAKKLAMTCRSNLDDEKEKEAEKKKGEEEDDVDALLEEAFLQQYISQRMEEMMANTAKRVTFGRLIHLESREAFLDAIDKEDKCVTVIIHIFEKGVPGCAAMTGCLGCMAQDYPHVKFCTLPASVAGVSANFKAGGCPALLVYKAGQLVGNFIRLTDEFSDDFYATDVESFLVEHGILVDRSLVPPGIRGPAGGSDDEDGGGSDFSLDD